ncbi:hypothetical protein H696_02876 [Fonticula alba]|uniref:Uncharacterized protein n=1 Tax=Fonticula alba TaxID=691883 RepID=A0A058Z8G6_FONAL|nr:hypothetical protein H696_02876 [Fonticula alba]KCV70530.1 hypothetical protein H696_02876 [Fonticula alba]|eukprot:XP_009495046.1 hypothetical protein H696_02876 [Fonticula alba]
MNPLNASSSVPDSAPGAAPVSTPTPLTDSRLDFFDTMKKFYLVGSGSLLITFGVLIYAARKNRQSAQSILKNATNNSFTHSKKAPAGQRFVASSPSQKK